MSKYYNNMKALHISYAAFNMDNDNPEADYIRVRQYPVTIGTKFAETEVPPSFDITGLFKPGETYKITVIKSNSKLFFQAEGRTNSSLFEWKLDDKDAITEGRIGLRHMFTRSARYKDFKVYTM